MGKARGNLAVGQSGGPTVVINTTLCAIIQEALCHEEIGELYGMFRGIRGLLNDQLIDLRKQPAETIQGLRHTPSSALGTARYRVSADDHERLLKVLKARNIRYLFYIGGNDSADTSLKLHKLSIAEDYELHVIAVPKTVDNDLFGTDHCPGYGSAARFVASAVRDTGRDTEAMGPERPVKIVEIMGRNAGWLTASSSLAREDEGDAPHLVYVPERPVGVEQLVEDVARCYREREHVVIAMSEGAQESPGKTLGEEHAPTEIDAFGHRMKGGVSEYAAALIKERTGLRVRIDKPNYMQRSFMLCASTVDLAEAYEVGRRAVQEALTGRLQGLVTLVRESGPTYRCSTAVVPLEDVANREKKLPSAFMNQAGNWPSEAFLSYARPLVGEPWPPIPYVRLTKHFV